MPRVNVDGLDNNRMNQFPIRPELRVSRAEPQVLGVVPTLPEVGAKGAKGDSAAHPAFLLNGTVAAGNRPNFTAQASEHDGKKPFPRTNVRLHTVGTPAYSDCPRSARRTQERPQ